MGAETSPVYAPSFSQKTSCAPISMRVDFADSTAIATLTKGGQITTSACSKPATRGAICAKNAAVSGPVLCIFQLPAMTGLRMRVFQERFFRPYRGRRRVLCALLTDFHFGFLGPRQ